MNTLILAVTLAAMVWSAWHLVVILRQRRADRAAAMARSQDSSASMAADRLLDDARLRALPFYVRAGHSFLVFTDFEADYLEIDGVDVGNPDRLDADGERTFYGYYNVTPGTHQLMAYRGSKVARFTLEVAPNRAYVKRLDWARSLWVDVDLPTQARFRNLVWSGLLLEGQALHPWPLASLYFVNAPQPLLVNGKLAPAADFFGLTDLPPGEIVLSTEAGSTSWTFPPKCMHVVTFAKNEPQLLDPRASAVLVGRMLRASNLSTLVPHAHLSASELIAPIATAQKSPVENIEPVTAEPALAAQIDAQETTLAKAPSEDDLADAARDTPAASSPIPDQIIPFHGYGIAMTASPA